MHPAGELGFSLLHVPGIQVGQGGDHILLQLLRQGLPLACTKGTEGGKAGPGLTERPGEKEERRAQGEKEGADKWVARLWGKIGSTGLL